MSQRRQYANPPIQEALCEIRFERGRDWTVLTAGRLLEHLADDYPAAPQMQRAGGIELEDASEATSVRWRAGEERVLFASSDGSRLVLAGPTSLGIHVLRPYEGWEAFSERISRAIAAYSAVLTPVGVRRLGVRYVNRLVLPESAVDLDDYFTIGPRTPSTPPASIVNFITRVEANHENEPVRLVQTFASAGAEDGCAAVVLDLDVIREFPDTPLEVEEADGAIERLRTIEREAFESMITDKSREMFDAS